MYKQILKIPSAIWNISIEVIVFILFSNLKVKISFILNNLNKFKSMKNTDYPPGDYHESELT